MLSKSQPILSKVYNHCPIQLQLKYRKQANSRFTHHLFYTTNLDHLQTININFHFIIIFPILRTTIQTYRYALWISIHTYSQLLLYFFTKKFRERDSTNSIWTSKRVPIYIDIDIEKQNYIDNHSIQNITPSDIVFGMVVEPSTIIQHSKLSCNSTLWPSSWRLLMRFSTVRIGKNALFH